MWAILLVSLMVAAAIHSRFSTTRKSELFLVYLLAGYCGIAQIAFGLAMLLAPAEWQLAHMPRVQPDNPAMTWVAFLWIGMGTIGALTIWLRGIYIVAPLVGWSIFWSGATLAHSIHDGPITVLGFLHMFAVHGLIAILLVSLGLAFRRKFRDQPREA
jgi:hypothetical protein